MIWIFARGYIVFIVSAYGSRILQNTSQVSSLSQ